MTSDDFDEPAGEPGVEPGKTLEPRPATEPDPLLALQEGHQEPFERFVTREARSFFGFFRRLGCGPDEAEDLAQEVFLRLYQCAANYRPAGRFRGYAFRIARNVWVDRRRRRATRPLEHRGADSVGDTDQPNWDPRGSTPEPGAKLAAREEVTRVRDAVAALSETHRLVFELAIVRELPYADVGEALAIPVGTVKSRVFYALRQLRERLSEFGSDCSATGRTDGERLARAEGGSA